MGDTKPSQRKYLAGLNQGEKIAKGSKKKHVPGTGETGHGPGRSASNSKTRLHK